MKTIAIFCFVTIAALALVGCNNTATNSNGNSNIRTANANTNMGYSNPNSNIVVVNNNTAAANTNRWNSNISKEEYNKDRANYEKDKGTSTIGQGAEDSWLWFKTRSALAAVNDLRDSTINVDVVNGVITLKGTVANADQKKKAEDAAKGIEGKKSVTNQLTVSANDSLTNQTLNGNSNSGAKTNSKTK
jgi:hyperosmotically inducible periplasmic protein